MNIKFLAKTPVFKDFNENEIEEALNVLSYRVRTFDKEEIIFQEGDRVTEMGIILNGSVRIERIDYQGNRNIMAQNVKGQIFSETYAVLPDVPIMVDVVAGSGCEVLFINLANLKSDALKKYSWYAAFLENMFMISSRKNLQLSMRNFHTFSKHIRDRVISYLTAQAKLNGSLDFDIPFNRQQMADYLSVERSALSFELSKMRDDGLIEFRKNHFKLSEDIC